MEFQITYTKEQEEFRKEVRAWLEQNGKMPPDLGEISINGNEITDEQRKWSKGLRQKLGHQGWLYPTMPKELGGGGLTVDHDIIIKEELRPYGDVSASGVAVAGLYVYGTDEQKEKLLKPLLRGDIDHGLLWTEPDSGVDLASVKTRAIRDGDDYVLNGVKCYISAVEPDYMWLLAVTDPEAPRHANLGHFFMPNYLPGVQWQRMELINRGTQHFVFFDNVRVPREYLIGGETQGWQVAQSSLELEHGAAGSLYSLGEDVVDELIEAWQEGKVRSLAQGDAAREHLVDAYIRNHVNSLIGRRNFWMFRAHERQSYHGPQSRWFSRETRIRTAEDFLDLLGPHSLSEDREVGLLKGRIEYAQRNASMSTHGGGSYEIDKVIIARRVGMSRTHETAAPTH
ncbi:MAG: hypothetical protein HW403_236 [Dehalococcoidia bacterium]|nr:hypothetical protein [Dehalococcoidia bacterium]